MSDSTLNRFVGEGDDAQEAAFTPSPPTPAAGPDSACLFVNKEDPAAPILKWWDGADFITLADTLPALVKIEEQSPSGTGTVTFSSLGAYTHLRVLYTARGTQVATGSSLNMAFNADATAIYDLQRISGAAAVVGAAESLAQTSILNVGVVAAASATADMAGSGEIVIYDYRGTTFHKQVTSSFLWQTSTASGALTTRTVGGVWRSTAAITSITLALGSGNYVAGSKLSLYGLR